MTLPVVSAVLLWIGALCFVIGASLNLWLVLRGAL